MILCARSVDTCFVSKSLLEYGSEPGTHLTGTGGTWYCISTLYRHTALLWPYQPGSNVAYSLWHLLSLRGHMHAFPLTLICTAHRDASLTTGFVWNAMALIPMRQGSWLTWKMHQSTQRLNVTSVRTQVLITTCMKHKAESKEPRRTTVLTRQNRQNTPVSVKSPDRHRPDCLQVHGDVFRPPTNPSLLSVYVGTGMQLIGMSVVTMIFAVLGFLSPANRGGLMTAMLLLFVVMGIFGGYYSARLYKLFKVSQCDNGICRSLCKVLCMLRAGHVSRYTVLLLQQVCRDSLHVVACLQLCMMVWYGYLFTVHVTMRVKTMVIVKKGYWGLH